MAKRQDLTSFEHRVGLLNAAIKLRGYFKFDKPGPSPIDYPDQIQQILQESDIHRIRLIDGRERAVSRTCPWDLAIYAIRLYEDFRDKKLALNYYDYERARDNGLLE